MRALLTIPQSRIATCASAGLRQRGARAMADVGDRGSIGFFVELLDGAFAVEPAQGHDRGPTHEMVGIAQRSPEHRQDRVAADLGRVGQLAEPIDRVTPNPMGLVGGSGRGRLADQARVGAEHQLVDLGQVRRRSLARGVAGPQLGTPAFREELVREAVLGLLGGAKAHGQAIAGAEIAVVDLPDKPRHGPRPPAVVTVQTKAGPRRIAVDVNSAPAQATVRVLTRLRDTVEEGRADCAVLLRERAAPLPESAKKSHELLAELSATGGAAATRSCATSSTTIAWARCWRR
jgi:hypothetical protein